MRTAYLFPGQGSQLPGMGSDLYDTYAEARAVFDEADRVLEFSLTSHCFAHGQEAMAALTRTDVCQPAIFAHSVAAFRVLECAPDMVAGHSVGEYSALAACGAISLADGLRTVRQRARLMAQAGQARPGTMCAVLGLDEDSVRDVCRAASDAEGHVQPANFNAPGQVVISGDRQAVAHAGELAKARGARRVIPLKVSGAFHSMLMQAVHHRFARTVEALDIRRPRCPIYLNATAEPTTDPREIRLRMLQQLTAPVRWMQSLHAMQADGAARFVEVGPGRILSGLVRRTLGRKTLATQVSTRRHVEQMHASHEL